MKWWILERAGAIHTIARYESNGSGREPVLSCHSTGMQHTTRWPAVSPSLPTTDKIRPTWCLQPVSYWNRTWKPVMVVPSKFNSLLMMCVLTRLWLGLDASMSAKFVRWLHSHKTLPLMSCGSVVAQPLLLHPPEPPVHEKRNVGSYQSKHGVFFSQCPIRG